MDDIPEFGIFIQCSQKINFRAETFFLCELYNIKFHRKVEGSNLTPKNKLE